MNKKWPALFLVLLLLCGCGAQGETDPTSSEAPAATHPAPEPTESVGFYQPESILEVSTGGAVKTYPLDLTDAVGIRFLGEDILLFAGSDSTTLTLLSGSQRYIKAQCQLPFPVSPEDPAVVVSAQGLAYADRADQALVFLNAQLQEVSRISLPESCSNIVLSQDRRLLYYCTPESLRVLDLESGVDRLLKEMRYPCQELTALHKADTVLQCDVTYDDGSARCLFLSAEDGSLLAQTEAQIPLQTANDLYFATHMDGTYPELITGSFSDMEVLVPEQEYLAAMPVLDLQGLLLYRLKEDGRAVLDWYQLDSGIRSAQVTLPGPYHPRAPVADPTSNTLWFLCYDNLTEQDLLCAWDLDASPTGDDACYLQPRYTPENPDLEGLEECRLLARQISVDHDVQVLIWTDATAYQPWDYTLIPEHQVPLIRKKLAELDEILCAYPEGFLKEAASQTGSGRLTLCLVRAINGNPDVGNALASAAGLQFWDQAAQAYLAVAIREDISQQIHHELFHIIDSRVLSSCDAYDNWNSLNPKGFSYDNNYTAGSSRNQAYLSGENRYFIDLYSTSYPKEDRARIMEYAMQEGRQNLFLPAPIQAKLRQLCIGIREAFHLEQDPRVFRWEQYLVEPIHSGK